VLETWGGKYLALVDEPKNARFRGSAVQVMTKEYEDEPRAYVTDAYEVARCIIEFEGRVEPGCPSGLWDRSMRRGAVDEAKKLTIRL
jgi:hypothetical protein